jgi:CubicO group peptidase (beta-lactamase class C family)
MSAAADKRLDATYCAALHSRWALRKRAAAAVLSVVVSQPLTAQSAARELDPSAVQRFVATDVGELLRRSPTPGVVVAVVQRDQVVALAGIGTADVRSGAPIDPQRTLFRIGSITKVMTTIAALRFAARGQLSLDQDVNTYLTVARVPDTFPQPVTARIIIAHQGGFETVLHHLQVHSEAEAHLTSRQLEQALIRVRPVDAPRIYDDLSYGVLGTALANIAHRPYASVLEEEVFRPLGMTHATVGLPPDRIVDAAQCHELGENGNARVCKQAVLVDIARPAGDATVTGLDMAHFMSGLLQPGRVLNESDLNRMKDVSAGRLHPLAAGLGMTLWESSAGGRVLYGHEGGIDGFISVFALFPGADIGVFMSADLGFGSAPSISITGMLGSQGPSVLSDGQLGPKELLLQFLEDFAQTFVPLNAPPEDARARVAAQAAGSEPAPAMLSGSYFRPDQSRSLLIRMLASLTGENVSANPNGSLTINGHGPFTHSANSYYRSNETVQGQHGGYVFAVDARGRLLIQKDEAWFAPFGVHQKQPWYATASWSLLPLPILLFIQLSGFGRLVWEEDARRRRIFKLGAVSAGGFFVALLLELQFGELFDHEPFQAAAVTWRLLFPAACAGFLFNAWLMVDRRTAPAVSSKPAPVAAAYANVIAITGLGLVWLAVFWKLATLFLRL